MSGSVHNPVDVENKIEETKNRIADGIKVCTTAERAAKAARRDFDLAFAIAYGNAEGPVQDRKYKAEIETMPLREVSDNAEITYKHAERTARALDKELFAWQAISKSVIAMYGAVRA